MITPFNFTVLLLAFVLVTFALDNLFKGKR